MEQLAEKTGTSDSDASLQYELWDLRRAIDNFLSERGVGRFCNVTANKNGHWYELKGTVDSQWTRCVLFSLVPKTRDRRYIIDKLQVVDPLLERTAWA